ncbi:hypothetical protein M513_03570 [Trichuris suis]|uniref:2-oxoisovalerate dehydrogenase subunit alpha n=1 Tax=Trichuris suis TaxID=68888 RepID=A0A085ME72_9BILA|nr:hypothetical protein M513_03570 [Trichuris suis]
MWFHRLGGQLLPYLASGKAVRRWVNTDAELLSHFSKTFFANRSVSFTEEMEFKNADSVETIPIFRLLNSTGCLLNRRHTAGIDGQLAVRMLKNMIFTQVIDDILYNAQRQGRISFYMTNLGEEACALGSAAALKDDDLIFAQYRELGPLLWRGYPLQSLVDQCVGNEDDTGLGRQMPVHYGSKEKNYVTISSTLATQMPQAVGSAYISKMNKEDRVALCYFGDGASSEGDCHAAFNFASTLRCPVIFFCRNNAYAISTSVSEQYGGDGVAGRGPAYGLATIRVDGNDILAVYSCVEHARKLALQGQPCLIEAMTYRIGHHSTSDDSTAYRLPKEVAFWSQLNSPLSRLRSFLLKEKLFTLEEESKLEQDYRKDVISALTIAEKKKKPPIDSMFTHVYDVLTPRLEKQKSELLADCSKMSITSYPNESFSFPCLRVHCTPTLPEELTNSDKYKEIGDDAEWVLSTCKPGYGVQQLRDGRFDTYWQSDGSQPHTINIFFTRKTKVSHVCIFTDVKTDESYTPNRISIRRGTSLCDLSQVCLVEIRQPNGWAMIPLQCPSTHGVVRAFVIQIAIVQNHQNGRDSHVRQVRIFGPKGKSWNKVNGVQL